MHWFRVTAVLVVLGSASVFAAPADAANSTSSLASFGVLEFLKPILVGAVGENTLLAVQNNLVNLITALGSGNRDRILNAVLSIVDPQHVVRNSLKMFNNYESHMWDPQFRQEIAGVLKGISKAVKSGISCFGQNIEGTMDNFTSNYIVAMKTAFESTRPNSTEPPPPLLAVPTTIINTLRLLFDMVMGSSVRGAVADGIKSTLGSFQQSVQCALQNTTDLKKSWQSLHAILMSDSTATTATPGIIAKEMLPTQVVHTTLAPAIVVPTTAATTVAPTTIPTTTVAPTTVPTTTVAPTTTPTTTVAPTTTPTTTLAPTTTKTTTVAPTTTPTTTVAPTTTPTTTVAPTTTPTTTVAPTTTTKRAKFLGIF